MTNDLIAEHLRLQANDPRRIGHNLYRARAFRQAAIAVLGFTEPIQVLWERGEFDRVRATPGIGKSTADFITALLEEEENPESLPLSESLFSLI
jgi:DNA polymerase/3'-5' exonuclease PolX